MTLKECVIALFDKPDSDLKDRLDELFKACFYVGGVDESKNILDSFKIDCIAVNFDDNQSEKLNAIKYIRSRNADVPLLIATAHKDKVAKLLNSYDILDFLSSPIDTDELSSKVSKNEQRISEYMAKTHEDTTLTKTLTIKESIEVYFKKIVDDLLQYKSDEFGDKRMSFDIVRRFLFTAYNNLLEIDYSLEDKELKTLRLNFEAVIQLKSDFEKKIRDTIESNYEKIYLRKNTEFLALYNEFEDIKTKMGSLRNELGIITRELEDVKQKRKKATKGSPESLSLDESFKRLNAKNIDKIHELSQLKDRIYDIDEKMEAIRKKYFEEFKSTFEEEIDSLKFDLKEVLDIFSYRFDKAMWHKAKTSRNVKEFFKEAQIEGILSCKTYLQYYVHGLDESMASEGTKKVIKYLNEYNKKNKILVALVGSDIVQVSKEKNVVNMTDEILEGRIYTDAKEFLIKFEIEDFGVVIMDAVIAKKRAVDIIDFLKKKFPEKCKSIHFAIRLKDTSDVEEHTRAFNRGIKFFFFATMNKEEFRDTLLKIL